MRIMTGALTARDRQPIRPSANRRPAVRESFGPPPGSDRQMPTPHPPPVLMYTLAGCVHCRRTRRLLASLDIAYEERRLDGVAGFRALLAERTGGHTVPQIVIRGEPIGGASELARLQRRGVLPARVRGDAFPIEVRRRRLTPGRLLAAIVRRPRSARRAVWRHVGELRDADGRVIERPERAAGADTHARAADPPSGPAASGPRRGRSDP